MGGPQSSRREYPGPHHQHDEALDHEQRAVLDELEAAKEDLLAAYEHMEGALQQADEAKLFEGLTTVEYEVQYEDPSLNRMSSYDHPWTAERTSLRSIRSRMRAMAKELAVESAKVRQDWGE